jgi:hypothetical protein
MPGFRGPRRVRLLSPISQSEIRGKAPAATRTGILLGYSRLREVEIREGIRRLGEVV